MKPIILGLILATMGVHSTYAQQPPTSTITTIKNPTPDQKEVMQLSTLKWHWMANKNVDSLRAVFEDSAMFVHMGGSWGKSQEIDVINTGTIWYKQAEVYAVSVQVFGNTAILLNDIDLVAVVGGNEVVHAFMVTEVYLKNKGRWTMGSLTFSQLRRPVKLKLPSSK